MLALFKFFLPSPKVRTLAALQQFLSEEAAHLAQRSVIDFVRNELGSLSAQAFGDPRFQAKLAVSRWEGFAAILADMIMLARACLEAAGTPRAPLDIRLGDLYATILASHPAPDHRVQGWDAEITALRARLAAAPTGAAGPQPYAVVTGAMVFGTLPFVPRDPAESRMVLSNAFAFGLIAFNDRLKRLLMVAPLHDELVESQQ